MSMSMSKDGQNQNADIIHEIITNEGLTQEEIQQLIFITNNINNQCGKSNTEPGKTIKEKQEPKRCQYSDCMTKLNIFTLECKCGLKFCNKHKFFTDHMCNHDYKGEYAKILKNKNPQIIGEKIRKI
ncbi:AN1-type zinc finger protein 6-like [Hydra vulgaris]|uniref:AN1-type zinc finger protein 6-like n=1 Tax=Hydra vulgaris TaxID=6087 RepID=UPI001F5EA5BA|nr:AN1-type zinc finger protein 6-like [Hydra vulgaris]